MDNSICFIPIAEEESGFTAQELIKMGPEREELLTDDPRQVTCTQCLELMRHA